MPPLVTVARSNIWPCVCVQNACSCPCLPVWSEWGGLIRASLRCPRTRHACDDWPRTDESECCAYATVTVRNDGVSGDLGGLFAASQSLAGHAGQVDLSAVASAIESFARGAGFAAGDNVEDAGPQGHPGENVPASGATGSARDIEVEGNGASAAEAERQEQDLAMASQDAGQGVSREAEQRSALQEALQLLASRVQASLRSPQNGATQGAGDAAGQQGSENSLQSERSGGAVAASSAVPASPGTGEQAHDEAHIHQFVEIQRLGAQVLFHISLSLSLCLSVSLFLSLPLLLLFVHAWLLHLFSNSCTLVFESCPSWHRAAVLSADCNPRCCAARVCPARLHGLAQCVTRQETTFQIVGFMGPSTRAACLVSATLPVRVYVLLHELAIMHCSCRTFVRGKCVSVHLTENAPYID